MFVTMLLQEDVDMNTLDLDTPAPSKAGWDRPTCGPDCSASQELTAQAGLPESVSALMRPADVVSAPGLTETEKRAVLASWISDARTVLNAPALRKLENGAVVRVDDILHALKSLDVAGTSPGDRTTSSKPNAPARRPRRTRISKWLGNLIYMRRSDDDDDDPPPCPAAVGLPIGPTLVAPWPAPPSVPVATTSNG